jgi:hypothetical protein
MWAVSGQAVLIGKFARLVCARIIALQQSNRTRWHFRQILPVPAYVLVVFSFRYWGLSPSVAPADESA